MRPAVQFVEDYDLWLRVAEHGVLENLQESLLKYRKSVTSVSIVKAKEQTLCVALAWISAFRRRAGETDFLEGLTTFPSWKDALQILESHDNEALSSLGKLALVNPDLTIVLKSPAVVAAVLARQITLGQLELLL